MRPLGAKPSYHNHRRALINDNRQHLDWLPWLTQHLMLHWSSVQPRPPSSSKLQTSSPEVVDRASLDCAPWSSCHCCYCCSTISLGVTSWRTCRHCLCHLPYLHLRHTSFRLRPSILPQWELLRLRYHCCCTAPGFDSHGSDSVSGGSVISMTPPPVQRHSHVHHCLDHEEVTHDEWEA